MAQLQLDTVCACVVRALIAVIFGRDRDSADVDFVSVRTSQLFVRRSEKMMRRFRDGVLARSSVGKIIKDAVAQTVPDVSRALAQDETAFGLAVDMLEPWVKASTSLAVLQRKVDKNTVKSAITLGKRIIQLCPGTAKRIEPMIELIQKAEGVPVSKLIGRLQRRKLAKIVRPKRGSK